MNMTAAMKRVTIITRDMDKALAFYRDLLGFDIFYEGDVGGEGVATLMGVKCEKIRMKVLQSEGSEVGMIGLMQFLNAEDPPAAIETPARPSIGEPILVIPTTKMKELVQRLKDGGYTLISEPVRMEVPNRPPVHELCCRDPRWHIGQPDSTRRTLERAQVWHDHIPSSSRRKSCPGIPGSTAKGERTSR